MSENHYGENIVPEITREEHEGSKNAKRVVVVGDLSTYGSFNNNDIDDYTTTNVVYVCAEDKDGTWMIKKIDSTGNYPTFRFATIANNPTMTTYALAFTNRVTLTYDLFNVSF